ncbi:MAG: acyl-CoA thioesterase [Gammaproteobacteria bacterium]|jgi:acyl-CoA thioester hydrolase|nr:acyl-CoA thioesterase [Gammaproteobacteria bacterium]
MTNIEQLQQDYAHTTPIVVKWGEMDAFQHINNVAYIRYLEDARLALFAQLGMLNDLTACNKGPILANISCDYLAPVTYPDTLYIATNIHQTGPKKIALEQVIYSEKLGKLVAKAHSLGVYYDYAALASCEVTEAISQALNKLNQP